MRDTAPRRSLFHTLLRSTSERPLLTEKSLIPPSARELIAVDVPVLGSRIHTIEHGSGAPIVFIHGNPTSSYLWRDVFRPLRGRGRLLALDLIGYGDSSKPDIEYSLENQQRYVDAWFDALDLRDVTLVLQDYGSAFGLDWASRHPDRVRAVAFFEPVLRSIESASLLPEFVATRAKLRRSGEGEAFVLQENRFLTELFPGFFLKPLAPEDLQQYQAAFPTPESRKSVLAGPRNLPVDGEPASTVAFLGRSTNWLTDERDTETARHVQARISAHGRHSGLELPYDPQPGSRGGRSGHSFRAGGAAGNHREAGWRLVDAYPRCTAGGPKPSPPTGSVDVLILPPTFVVQRS